MKILERTRTTNTPQHAPADDRAPDITGFIFDLVEEAVIVIDDDGRIIKANERSSELFGTDAVRLVGSSLYDAIPLEWRPAINQMIETARRGGATMEHEVSGDNRVFRVRIRAAVEGSAGNVPMAVLMKDITRERLLEKTLDDLRRNQRRIVDTANEGICHVDEHYRVILFNRHAQQMFGYSEEEMLGGTLDELLFTEDLDSHHRRMEDRKAGKSEQYERRFRRKDGTPLWAIVSASPILDADGTFRGSVSIFTDIDSRMTAEEAVRESEERYRTAIEHSNDGVAMLHADTFIYANQRFVDIFGYNSPDDIIGRKQEITVHPDDKEMVVSTNLRRQAGEEVPESYQFKGIRKDGSVVHLEVSATKTVYRDQVVALAYLRDITTRKQMEDELRNFRTLESIGILAGGIAHDFNNLLMSMMGYISLAKLYLQPEESKARDRLIEAEKTIDKAKGLTNQLITFSKGGSPIKKVVELQPLIREAVRLPLSGSFIRCKYRFEEGLWGIKADDLQLRQVIHQLVRNSREAMPDGGSISISARNVNLEDEPGGVMRTGPYVELNLSDTGKGIAKEHLSQVFDPYFSTKDFGPQKGMGLGLAVCYSIIKKHGGQIEVESELNEGTTFRIFLPAEAPEQQSAPAPSRVESARPKTEQLRILIADDEESILQTTTMLLTHLGHDVTAVLDGRAAVELYRQAKESGRTFDIVILDLVSSKGPDGVQILDDLLLVNPAVTAVLSSGYPNDPQIINYRDRGFKGVLLKPYRIEDLKRVLQLVRGVQ